MVTPIHPRQSCDPNGFYQLATATLDEARSIVRFRLDRTSHPDWAKVRRTLPEDLLARIDELEAAESAARDARKQGGALVQCAAFMQRQHPPGTPAHRIRETFLSAEARLAEARNGLASVSERMIVAEDAAAKSWQQEHERAFRSRRDEYAAAFRQYELGLAGRRSKFGELLGSSACEVLLHVADMAIRVMDGDLTLRRVASSKGPFEDLDWEELRVAVRNDAAELARSTSEPRVGSDPGPSARTSPDGEVSLADAMTRYSHSRDDMQTMLLNPIKAIPFDNYPEETQLGRGVITRGKNVKNYVRYLLRVAAENERLVQQARLWWAWWEKAQVDPSKAGPAPLVSSRIEVVLRMAAQHRGTGGPKATRAAADGASSPLSKGRPEGRADRLVTVEAAAKELGAPPRTIRNWISKADKLQPVDRLGGPRKVAARYRLVDIEARRPDRI
ncbi:MAG TPA: hypothetical protein VFZ65_01455 [Planctomycetota bacterium]|nr:hypothetical protein [Planctomycetota bacterium]